MLMRDLEEKKCLSYVFSSLTVAAVASLEVPSLISLSNSEVIWFSPKSKAATIIF